MPARIPQLATQSASRLSRRAAFQSLIFAPVAASAYSPAAPQPFPCTRLLRELAIDDGPYQGAYRCMPNGPINWYFANLGLYFFVDTAATFVRGYLDAYLRAKDPLRHNIADVAPDLATRQPQDSDDAYAGTFLRLAVRYVRASGDMAWWRMNLPQLKAIAYCNILTQIKSNGFVRAFQAPAENGIGYLMDQCEVYAGLRDFAEYLLETADPDAAYYSKFPVYLGVAIHTLFDPSRNSWNWCDVTSPDGSAWYPNLTAQIYPHLCDVHSADAPGDYYRLYRGFDVLQQGAADFAMRPQDLYPWLVVGYYAAAIRKEPAIGLQMVSMARRYYLPGSVNTGRFTIADIGYVAGILGEASQPVS